MHALSAERNIHSDYIRNCKIAAPIFQPNSIRYAFVEHFISHFPPSRIPHSQPFSIKIVLINLIRHNHHPQQKHRPDNIKRKRSLPILTDPLRLQPRQRRFPIRQPRTRLVQIAIAVYGPGGPVELDGRFDEAGQEEHEEDEGAEDYDAGEELALLD